MNEVKLGRQNLLGTNVATQIAVVVRDIDKAIDAYSELLGVPKPNVIITDPDAGRDVYRGKSTRAQAKLAFFELGQVRVEVVDGVQAQLMPRLPEQLPLLVAQVAYHGGARAQQVMRRLLHGGGDVGRDPPAVGPKVDGGRDLAHRSPRAARTSIMCTAATADPIFCRPPAMFIRQPGSPTTTYSAPLAWMLRTLSASIAAETSG